MISGTPITRSTGGSASACGRSDSRPIRKSRPTPVLTIASAS